MINQMIIGLFEIMISIRSTMPNTIYHNVLQELSAVFVTVGIFEKNYVSICSYFTKLGIESKCYLFVQNQYFKTDIFISKIANFRVTHSWFFSLLLQMTIKCSAWDKLKTLSSHSGPQISNLAKLLTHLFIHKGLPISTLKVRHIRFIWKNCCNTNSNLNLQIVEFSDLDKVTLRLIRQILLGILLHDDLEEVQAVFSKIALSDKLKMFRDSLRLFIHHFLLRNLKGDVLSDDQKQHLETRSKMVEQILTTKEFRLSR